MPPPRASVAYSSSRLPDDDPKQRYMDLFIALTVLEKLEVSYSKSLLTLAEYEAEYEAAIKQARKAHQLIRDEFPTFEAFAKEFGGRSGQHEFERAIMQLEGGQDLMGGLRAGNGGNPFRDGGNPSRDDGVENGTEKGNGNGNGGREVPGQIDLGEIVEVCDCVNEIKTVIEAYEDQDRCTITVGRVRNPVRMLVEALDRLEKKDSRALVGSVQERAEKMRQWRERLDGMSYESLICSQELAVDASALPQAWKG